MGRLALTCDCRSAYLFFVAYRTPFHSIPFDENALEIAFRRIPSEMMHAAK